VLTNNRIKLICGSLLLGGMAILSAPAYAANEAMMDLLKILRGKGSITQEEYELLVNAAKADAEAVADVKTQMEAKTKDLPKIETRDKLAITSQDGDFEWQLIGRIMADYHMVDSDVTPIDTEGAFRRARLGMQGRLWKHWIWKLEYDFANGAADLKDGYVGYEDKYSGGGWNIKVGQHHIPFGLATLSSSKYLTLLERPLLADDVLQPARHLGLSGFVNGGEKWTFQAGVFGANEGGGGTDPETFEELSFAARATINPYIRDKTHLAHLGGAVWYRDPNDVGVRVRQRPGVIRSSDTRFVDVNFGAGAIDDILAFNAEAAMVWGPFHLQSEYTNWDVSPKGPAFNAGSDVTLDGYYIDASYFLTGESMNFKTSEGVFSGVKPKGIVGKGGIGAWQVAARYDVLDLNDGLIIGGKEKDFRVGLKWYPTSTLNFMADYVRVLELDRPGSAFDNDEPGSFNLRAMVFW
jgi:phosphate-selective porin OprO/OprP